MNKCFDEFPVYRNRRYVSSCSRRARRHDARRGLYERALDICEVIVAFFESPLVRLAIRIASLTVAAVGFLLLVAAAEAGSVGFASGILSALGIVAAAALALRI